MEKSLIVIRWLVGTCFALLILAQLIAGYILSAILSLFLVLLILPPSSKRIFARFGKTVSRKFKIIGAIVLFVLMIKTSPSSSSTNSVPSPSPTIIATPQAVSQPTVETATIANEQITVTPELTQHQKATLISVTDGDTIKVSINGKAETIRVIGINTPETVDPRKSVECFGVEASKGAKSYFELSGTDVWVEEDPTQGERDKYNRLLRYVWTDDDSVDFGKIMISLGLANEYTYETPYKYQEKYKNAEREARDKKIGLWADDACPTATTKPTIQPTTVPVAQVSNSTTSSSHSCSGPDLDCKDFATHAEAQSFFNGCGWSATNDPMRLDTANGMGNGIACESLP